MSGHNPRAPGMPAASSRQEGVASAGAILFARQADGHATVAFYDQLTNSQPDLALGLGEKLEVIGDQGEWYSVRLVATHFRGRAGWVKTRNTHQGDGQASGSPAIIDPSAQPAASLQFLAPQQAMSGHNPPVGPALGAASGQAASSRLQGRAGVGASRQPLAPKQAASGHNPPAGAPIGAAGPQHSMSGHSPLAEPSLGAAGGPAASGVDASHTLPAELMLPGQQPEHLTLGVEFIGSGNTMTKWLASELKFPHEYVRDEAEFGWVTKIHGARLTGYDLVAAIRKYMHRTHNEHLSVCELLLSQGRTDMAGRADIFCSHTQMESWEETQLNIRNGRSYSMKGLRLGTFAWIDYFCLRQCQRDFVLSEMLDTIGSIGVTLATLCPQPIDYLTRSFCIFECVATVKAGGSLRLHMADSVYDQRTIRGRFPQMKEEIWSMIDAKEAKCLSSADKEQIDRYIDEAGEDVVNNEMKRQLGLWLKGWYEFEDRTEHQWEP